MNPNCVKWDLKRIGEYKMNVINFINNNQMISSTVTAIIVKFLWYILNVVLQIDVFISIFNVGFKVLIMINNLVIKR